MGFGMIKMFKRDGDMAFKMRWDYALFGGILASFF